MIVSSNRYFSKSQAVARGLDRAHLPEKPKEPQFGYVYFAYAPELKRVKIGWTTQDSPDARLGSRTDNPDRANVWGFLAGLDETREKWFHDYYHYLHLHKEWFAVDEHLYDFVHNHTYKPGYKLEMSTWKEDDWRLWQILKEDQAVQRALERAQVNPVDVIKQYGEGTAFFYASVKRLVCEAVGLERKFASSPWLQTSWAYDLVYAACVDLTPFP